jgi:hypothetical protein
MRCNQFVISHKMNKHVIMSIVLVLLICLYSVVPSFSEDRRWSTRIHVSNNHVAVFTWIGVYEGLDTVVAVKVIEKGNVLKEFKVSGQPVLNEDNSLLALPYCADDGCNTKIDIIDFNLLEKRDSVNLPRKGQLYLKCKWEKDNLIISTEAYISTKKILRKYEYSITDSSLKLLQETQK